MKHNQANGTMIENEKIRAEVERRYKWYQDEITKYMPHMVPDYEAKKEECKSILDFIDSPQEEPVSEDLEEAAKNSGQRHFPDEYNIWARPNYEAEHAELAFKEGANWQKQQMMKGAIEGVVMGNSYFKQKSVGLENLSEDEYQRIGDFGSRIKVIIVKED